MALELIENGRRSSAFRAKDILTVTSTKVNIFGLRSGAKYCQLLCDKDAGVIVIRYSTEAKQGSFTVTAHDNKHASFGGPGLVARLEEFTKNGHLFERTHDTGTEYWYKQVSSNTQQKAA